MTDDRERQRRDAFLIGVGTATPQFWERVVQTQLERLLATQEDFALLIDAAQHGGQPIPLRPDGYDPRAMVNTDLLIDAIYLVHAVRQVSSFTRKFHNVINDPGVGEALVAFNAEMPDIVLFRDQIEHLDEYAFGTGRHEVLDPEEMLGVAWEHDEEIRGELLLRFGGRSLRLKKTALAAMRLVAMLDEPWEKAMELLSQDE